MAYVLRIRRADSDRTDTQRTEGLNDAIDLAKGMDYGG
jgi:hypothetical protein